MVASIYNWMCCFLIDTLCWKLLPTYFFFWNWQIMKKCLPSSKIYVLNNYYVRLQVYMRDWTLSYELLFIVISTCKIVYNLGNFQHFLHPFVQLLLNYSLCASPRASLVVSSIFKISKFPAYNTHDSYHVYLYVEALRKSNLIRYLPISKWR